MTEISHTRCNASLLIYSGEHDPELVTARLGATPTSTSARGQVVGPNRVMRWRVESLNAWFLESASVLSEQSPLERHLDWLVERVSAEAVRDLVETLAMDARLRCVWWHVPGLGGGPTITPRHLRWMADAGIPLELDLGGELRS